MPDGPEAFEFELPGEAVLPAPSEIEAAMGYGPGAIPEYFGDMVRRALADSVSLIRARGACVEVEALAEGGAAADGRLRLGGSVFKVGQRIARRFAPLGRAAVFACTIGPGIGAQAKKSMERDEGLEAFALDAIASQAAENAAEALQRMVEKSSMERGSGATERYSPGYCGWPVSEQRLLFGLLPPGACGISLTESSMMVPEKSVSGIFGLGPGLSRRGYGCGDCDRLACPSRAGLGPGRAKKGSTT